MSPRVLIPSLTLCVATVSDLVGATGDAIPTVYEEHKLERPPGAYNFGYSVSVDGNVAAIGAPYENCSDGMACGAAYVYRYDGADWTLEDQLTAPDAMMQDNLGHAVAISRTVAVVGAPNDDDCGAAACGAAYVYRLNGSEWTFEQKLTTGQMDPPTRRGPFEFGWSVATDGDVVVVGGPKGGGTASIYRFDGEAWIVEEALTSPVPTDEDVFGYAVSVSNGLVLVGKYREGTSCITERNCGTGYVYRFDGGHWNLDAELTPGDDPGYVFGRAVAVNDGVAVVGSTQANALEGRWYGAAYVFRTDGDTWALDERIPAPEPLQNQWFSSSMSVDGNLLVVGAQRDPCATGEACGAAYAYRFNGIEWVPESKLVSSDLQAADSLGISISLSGDVAFVASPGSDAAYVFRCVPPPQPERYVEASALPDGDGLSWDTAFNDLQMALDVAEASDGTVTEIWVAAGTYKPWRRGDAGDPRSATFFLPGGLTIYGGFEGWETSIKERTLDGNKTILSGDVGVADDNLDNCYHVVSAFGMDGPAILDGLTIIDGNADGGTTWSQRGGGLYSEGRSVTIRHCTFLHNDATDGGGMYCGDGAESVLFDTELLDNSADRYGAGMYLHNGSAATLDFCTFRGNSAGHSGGGIRAYITYREIALTNCVFTNNGAHQGGAISAYRHNDLALTNCSFIGNWGKLVGGAIDCDESDLAIRGCVFNGNVTEEKGGACFLYSFPSLRTFEIINSTFAGNTALFGAGIYTNQPEVTLGVANSILWDNISQMSDGEASQIRLGSSTIQINHSCVQGWTGAWGGLGNTGNDPYFVDADGADDDFGTDDDDIHLLPGSTCIDAGDVAATPVELVVDIDSQPRIQGCSVDMGADESPHPGLDCSANGISDACEQVSLGDFDGSGMVDAADVSPFVIGLSGPDPPVSVTPPECAATYLRSFDIDNDGDIDLKDFASFMRYYMCD